MGEYFQFVFEDGHFITFCHRLKQLPLLKFILISNKTMFGNNSGGSSGNTAGNNMFNKTSNNNQNLNFSNSGNTPNPTPQSNNIFANNSNNPNKPNNFFSAGNTSNTTPQGNAGTMGVGNNNPTGGSGAMFNNNAPQNKTNNMFNNSSGNNNPNNTINKMFSNNKPNNSDQNQTNMPNTNFPKDNTPANTPNTNNNATGGVFGSNPNNPNNTMTPGNTNAGGFFTKGTNNTNPQANSITPNTGTGGTNNLIVKNNPPPPQAPGGNIFAGNAPSTSNPPSNTTNIFANKNTNPVVPSGSNTANNQPKPSNTGQQFANNPGSTNPQANQAPTGATGVNLFANNPPASSSGTQPPTNLFNQASQPASNNPVGGSGATGVQNTTGPILTQPRDDIQVEFEKSNQTVSEFLEEFRKGFLQSYEDLQKLSESTLKYLQEKQENQRLVRNFNSLEPMIVNKSQYVLKTLQSMQRQQEQIEKTISIMSKRLGQDSNVHELSRYLQDYEMMKDEVMKLQQEGGDWSDPSNEQLAHIFQNLNQVELQIREMDDQVQRYLSTINSYL